jgi:hypothetical protein
MFYTNATERVESAMSIKALDEVKYSAACSICLSSDVDRSTSFSPFRVAQVVTL